MTDNATLVERLRIYADLADEENWDSETPRMAAARIAELEAEKDRMMTALRAIAEGYPMETRDDRYIVVENPKYQPDDGSNPNLVIDCARPAP